MSQESPFAKGAECAVITACEDYPQTHAGRTYRNPMGKANVLCNRINNAPWRGEAQYTVMCIGIDATVDAAKRNRWHVRYTLRRSPCFLGEGGYANEVVYAAEDFGLIC